MTSCRDTTTLLTNLNSMHAQVLIYLLTLLSDSHLSLIADKHHKIGCLSMANTKHWLSDWCRRPACNRGVGSSRGDEEEAGQPGQRPMGCYQAAQHLPAGSLRLPLAGRHFAAKAVCACQLLTAACIFGFGW